MRISDWSSDVCSSDLPPQAGHWAWPGGFVAIDESLDVAAARLLRDKVGLDGAHLEQLYSFGAVDRDPRMRVITIAYLALLREDQMNAALRAGRAAIAALEGETVVARSEEHTSELQSIMRNSYA